MDNYKIRKEYLQIRDEIFESVLWATQDKRSSTIAYNEKLNQLARFETVHEKIVYLTTKALIFSFGNLYHHLDICMAHVTKLIKQNRLGLDKLDPLSVGNYLNHKTAVLENDWYDIYQIERAIKTMKNSMFYFDQTNFDDRKIFVRIYLSILLHKYGDYGDTIKYLEDALNLLENSTKISEGRRTNLNLRIRALLLNAKFKNSNISESIPTAYELAEEYLKTKNEYLFFNRQFLNLIEILLEVDNDQSNKMASKISDKFLEVKTQLNDLRFQSSSPTDLIYENEPFNCYMISKIINLRNGSLQNQISAFEKLDNLLKFKYCPVSARSTILKYQLQFILQLYEGFGRKRDYKAFLNKVNELISIGKEHRSPLDLLSGILLYARFLIINEPNIKAIEYLKNKRKEIENLGNNKMLELIDDEIEKITNITLKDNQVDRIRQLQIEKYISKANKFLE